VQPGVEREGKEFVLSPKEPLALVRSLSVAQMRAEEQEEEEESDSLVHPHLKKRARLFSAEMNFWRARLQ